MKQAWASLSSRAAGSTAPGAPGSALGPECLPPHAAPRNAAWPQSRTPGLKRLRPSRPPAPRGTSEACPRAPRPEGAQTVTEMQAQLPPPAACRGLLPPLPPCSPLPPHPLPHPLPHSCLSAKARTSSGARPRDRVATVTPHPWLMLQRTLPQSSHPTYPRPRPLPPGPGST